MSEIKYEIIEQLGVLSETEKGWKKELNLISWNEREPKCLVFNSYFPVNQSVPP